MDVNVGSRLDKLDKVLVSCHLHSFQDPVVGLRQLQHVDELFLLVLQYLDTCNGSCTLPVVIDNIIDSHLTILSSSYLASYFQIEMPVA